MNDLKDLKKIIKTMLGKKLTKAETEWLMNMLDTAHLLGGRDGIMEAQKEMTRRHL